MSTRVRPEKLTARVVPIPSVAHERIQISFPSGDQASPPLEPESPSKGVANRTAFDRVITFRTTLRRELTKKATESPSGETRIVATSPSGPSSRSCPIGYSTRYERPALQIGR